MKGVHVMGLQPKQQAVMSLVLLNFLMILTQKLFDDVADEMTVECAEVKKAVAIKAIGMFYSLIDVLATQSSYSRAKPKVVAVNTTAIQNILTAIEAFQPNNNYLEQSESNFVMTELKSIEKVANESFKHTYSEEEIRKAGVK